MILMLVGTRCGWQVLSNYNARTNLMHEIWWVIGWELEWRQILNGSFLYENGKLRIVPFDDETLCTHSIWRMFEVNIYSI